MTRTTGCFALIAVLSCACVEKTEEVEGVDLEQIKSLVSTAAPIPQHPMDVLFEGKIAMIGYDASVTTITPGQPFEVTWYWKVEKPLEEGWRLFTHIADARGESRVNADLFGPIREAYQPGLWKAGEYIKDTQTITLPAAWTSPAAKFLLGIWNGPHRLQVSRGNADKENRAYVLTLPVTVQPAPERLSSLSARRVTAPITIDGKLDEADWVLASTTVPFVDPMTGARGAFETVARVLFDAERVYVGFDVKDAWIKSSFSKLDDHLWEQDAIEVMLDPDGDGQNYFEVQVSPLGVVFDTRYDTVRQPRPFGDVAWSSQAIAKAVTTGTPNDDETDQGYVVEMSMPWTAFAVGATPASPPAEGVAWRMNFYVMDSQRDVQRAVAWSAPRVPDFHTPQRFATVAFGERAPAAPPVAVSPTHAAVPAPGATMSSPPSAAENMPVRPREIAAGRTQIELLPGAAETLRAKAKARAAIADTRTETPARTVVTPPTAPAH